MRKIYLSVVLFSFLTLLGTPHLLFSQVNVQIPSTEVAPVIDGTIDAVWNVSQNTAIEKVIAGSPVSSTDFSANFKTLWDQSGLYVLTVVTDDAKINDSGEVWQDDAVEIFIDIDNNKQTWYGSNDFQYTFRWNDQTVYSNNGGTDGVQFKITGTSTGYILETKFPWATVGLTTPKANVLLGFDVQVHDDDNGAERDNKFAWYATVDNTWSNPSLMATAKLVGEVSTLFPADKPKISVDRGFYQNPFDVTISTGIPGMKIYYTLDGSDPADTTKATIGISPVVVHIDPESSLKRGTTPGVVLRARSKKAGYDFSLPETRTYLFLNKLGLQTSLPGHDWPSESNIKGQDIDLLLDNRILTDSRYKNLIDDAFTEIPSISITTAMENLFDPASGIYVNAWDGRGEQWERPASVELLNPDGSDGFQINAGIRIRGGWSRNGYFRKHAFRLFFRDEYGEGKLDFPLFGDEGAKSFDKIDLRCPQNYSWSKGGGEAPYCTFTRDVFSRDLQREMGQPYTRSRYYHLYINGLYWGVFQTQERSEAKYAETYLGGVADDYDVIKRVGNTSAIEATDGTTASWEAVWNICQQGFSSNANYYKIQGLDATGKRDPSLKVLVDIDNLIDYMNVIFYTGNFDAPFSSFSGGPNNLYCIYNRNSDDGYKFFAHDNEHTLLYDQLSPGNGVNENRVSLGSSAIMNVSDFSMFQPQWLHYRLSLNAEYRMRFADRAYKHFYNNGVFTTAQATKLLLSRSAEIDTAIIAESARWGDVDSWRLYTKEDWTVAVNQIVNQYFPVRTDIVINQLKEEGLLSNMSAPQFRYNGTAVTAPKLSLSPGNILSIVNTGGAGSVKYTIDGSDPRLVGGNVSTKAVDGANQANISILQTCIVKARIFNGGNWSPLQTIVIVVNAEIAGLQLTEIHYNPLAQNGVSGSEYEFVELKNSGNSPINLTTCTFIDGIKFTFNNETTVNPGSFIVLASSAYAFKLRYGFSPNGEYDGQLDNKGERITLVNAVGDTLVTVKYGDNTPWPTSPDSLGFSLVPAVGGLSADWDDGNNWRASSAVGGSPNADDGFIDIPEVIINEILSNSETPQVDAIELFNPTSTTVNIGGWYLSDNRSIPAKWKIPAGTTIPANGYIVFNEGHYVNTTLAYSANEFGSAFSLSSHGEEVYLFSANSSGALTGYEHGFDFGEIETGITFGRFINSIGKEHFVAQASSTLNRQNGNPHVGPVVINQIMYNPDTEQYEFLELVNISAGDVKLFDETDKTPWKVSGVGFDFPSNITIHSGESVYLVEPSINPADFRAYANLENSVKVYNFTGGLKNEGEEITLLKAAPQYVENSEVKTPFIRIDKVDYNDNENWPDADGNGYLLQRIALNVYGNDPASWAALPPGIKIKTITLPDAIEKTFYSKTLIASGGTLPYTWSSISGTLPSGVSLNPVTGIIEGTPTTKGVFNVTIKVEDQSGGTDEVSLSLRVKENTLPVAVNDTVNTLQNYSVIANVLENDNDLDGDQAYWIITVSSAPLHGTATVNNDKTITYIPARGFKGTDRMTYRITDGKGFSEASLVVFVEEEVIVGETESRISGGSDDMEENIQTHAILNPSSDIELINDAEANGGDQIVGLRFQNIEIPEGATVTKAYIQFKTDETGNAATTLTIHGEASLNPVTFSTTNIVSTRPTTTAATVWQPQSWDIEGEVSEKQKTTDLAAIINEIVALDGWASGNAMAFIISGTGKRVAEAFEGDAAGAALLHIEYRTNTIEATVPTAEAGTDQNVLRGSTVQLDGGESNSSDGRRLNFHWTMVSKPNGSIALLSNPTVVDPTFVADKFGTYTLELIVDNGIYESEISTVMIMVENHAPVADAGANQINIKGSFIRLNGSASTDADGDPLTYSWSWVSKPAGSTAAISNPSMVNPTFTADVEGTYSLNLVVSDGLLTSVADAVTITIEANQPPVANAGKDQEVITGTLVNLDGSKSADPEEDDLTFTWILVTKPAGSIASISNTSAEKPSITPDKAGTYTIRLTVADGMNTSAPDEMVITSTDDQAPVAIAGADQTVNAKQKVTLDGSDSYDPEGKNVFYQWSIITKPAGSKANLVDPGKAIASFTPDISGLYAFKLRVSDGTYTSEDQVQITALRTNDVIAYTINESLKVYPNPFTDKLVVDYYSPEFQKVEFSLCSMSGAVIKRFEFNSNGNCSKILDLEDVSLTRGMYLLIVKSENEKPRTMKVTH
jgi:hypothetical protein